MDGRSDVYGLGAVAYFLLTGGPVFAGTTVLEICARHLHSPVEAPSARAPSPIPAGLEALVLACLEKDPTRRPARAKDLVDALVALDDVPPWDSAKGLEWWDAHRSEVRDRRRGSASTSSPSKTLGVGVDAAARAPLAHVAKH